MDKPIKVLFVGEARTGKTSTCKKLTGQSLGYVPPYVPTKGAEVYKFTNVHGTRFDIWDCAGGVENYGLRDGYFVDAEICVVFGYKQKEWVRDVQRVSEDVIVYVYNTLPQLKTMFESIIHDRSPKGHVTDSEITVINVLN